MSNKPEAPGYVYPTHDVEIINPADVYDKLYILRFVHGTYGVVANCEDDALETFGEWAVVNALGYILGDFSSPALSRKDVKRISQYAYFKLVEEYGWDAADEQTFPVNGGEYYLNELPAKIEQHEYTKLERVAHCCKGAMMPHIAGPIDVFEVEDENCDTVVLDAEYGVETLPTRDGGVMTVTRRNAVYTARLDMPGYLDRTEDYAFETIEEACDHLLEMYSNV